MGFFNEDQTINVDESGVKDLNALMAFIFEQQVSLMTEESRIEYLKSDEVKALIEAGVVGKRAVIRLTQADDLTRRIKIAAFQKAREKGDSDWDNLKKLRVTERGIIDRIMGKYSSIAKRDAILAQRNLLKISPNAFTRPVR